MATNWLPAGGGDAEDVLAEFARAGVNELELAEQLQWKGAESFSTSWNELMRCLAAKRVR